MSHVDEGTLHALVDDALPPAERDAVQAHLASCGECARRYAEATAMARQVMALLGALDDAPAAPVRVAPPVTAAPVGTGTPVTPLRARTSTLRKVAIAASVMLVAGVSYQVGRAKDASLAAPAAGAAKVAVVAERASQPSVVAQPDLAPLPEAPMAGARVPARGGPRAESEPLADRDAASVLSSVAERAAPLAAPMQAVPTQAPVVAAAPVQLSRAEDVGERRGRAAETPSAEAQVASGGASQRAQAAPMTQAAPAAPQAASQGVSPSATQSASQVADMAPPPPAPESRKATLGASASANTASGAVSALPKPVAIPGYTATEESSQPAIIRRRYVSSGGTPLVLVIVQAPGVAKRAPARRADAASEFVVSTANGRSTVRWQRDGRSYELQGTLAPDSLVKLATLLK